MRKKKFKWFKIIVRTLIALSVLTLVLGYFMVTQPFVRAVKSDPPAVSATRLEEHVRFLTETVHPRNYEETKNINAAADYIKQHLEETGVKVTEQFFDAGGKRYRNISAHFGPEQEFIMIVGAHYDSFSTTPGADDNASGVAGLLELALLLKNNPPKHAVELVAYTLEEPPFFNSDEMGSAVHARSVKAANRPVKVMISLEMIGYFSDEAGSQQYPISLMNAAYPTKGNYIGVIGQFSDIKETKRVKALMSGATDLPVYSINASTIVQGLDFSDHRNYWAEGFNAVMITDTAYFRNKNYHEPTDTADTLDYQRMAKVVQGTYAVVQGFDE